MIFSQPVGSRFPLLFHCFRRACLSLAYLSVLCPSILSKSGTSQCSTVHSEAQSYDTERWIRWHMGGPLFPSDSWIIRTSLCRKFGKIHKVIKLVLTVFEPEDSWREASLPTDQTFRAGLKQLLAKPSSESSALITFPVASWVNLCD